MTQTWNKDSVQNLLRTNEYAMKRAIVKIYERQTQDEKIQQATTQSNGIGFTGVDAKFLSSLAVQVISRGTLSPKQTAIARNKMPKYWKQILELIKEKEGVNAKP